MYDEYIASHSPQFKTTKKYVEANLKILSRDSELKQQKKKLRILIP